MVSVVLHNNSHISLTSLSFNFASWLQIPEPLFFLIDELIPLSIHSKLEK